MSSTPGATRERTASRESGEIAIIGMACLFPGAPDLQTYWRNILAKRDCITDPPPEAWDVDVFYDPGSDANDRVYCKRGGFIGPLAYFDPVAHGIMPKTVDGGEPDQWLALEVARAAFVDAGYEGAVPERERTAVILGKGTYLNRGNISVVQHGRIVDQTLDIVRALHPEFTEEELSRVREELKSCLPPFNPDTAPSLIPNMVSGRIANRLDLMGPNYTVDAACASSHIAVDHAVRGLESRDFDLALVGGVHVATPVPTLMLFCQLGALSRQERIRPFDKSADGTILGGGIGMVVLKRREDAERDGQRIYAVIRGVGISSDGRGASVTAPRLEGEVAALERSYQAAGVSPRTVGLIEAHGTGTPVGDVMEVAALRQVFGERDGEFAHCALGSVKSMMGHLMPAAGIAGIIKAALSLHHKVLPPTLNVDEPNPELELEKTPFYLNSESRPWIHGGAQAPRRAGVNAFGFGGINAHAILEEHDRGTALDPMPWDSEVIVLSAASRAELVERARWLRRLLPNAGDVNLRDLAFTINLPGDAGPARLSLVASSVEDLSGKLDHALDRLSDPACVRMKEVQGIYYFEEALAASGRVAFLFPGEGSQYVNMLADLCIHFPEVRESFDLMDRVFAGHERNFFPSDIVLPRPVFSDAERQAAEQRIWGMEGAFEAVLIANWALYTLLGRLGIRPDATVGHSTGEYTAMLASGMIDLSEESTLARFATELNLLYREQMASDSGMAGASLVAVGADVETIREVGGINGDIHIAMDNCPHQTVVVGSHEKVADYVEILKRRGLLHERLSFDRPYHTPLFENCAEPLRGFLDKWLVAPPRTTTYSCTSAAPFPVDLESIQDLAVSHWVRPVEFRKTVNAMYDDGVRIFVEVGPGGTLSGFVGDILRGRPHLAVPANMRSRSGTQQLCHLVGLLAAHGVPMDLSDLYARRSPRRLDLGELSGRRGSPDAGIDRRMKLSTGWIPMGLSADEVARLRSGGRPKEASSELPPEAESSPRLMPPPISAPATTGTATDVDQVMSSHLKTLERFLEVQSETMQTYLAGADAGLAVQNAEAPAATEGEVLPDAAAPAPVSADAAVSGAEELPAKPPAVPEADAAPDVRAALLEVVGERTGYPVEMLGLDLDLEADLGIDSIKRVEILGSFRQQSGLLGEEDMEALAGCRTLRQVIELVEGGAAEGSAGPSGSPDPVGVEGAPDLSGEKLPLLGTVVTMVPGKELITRREISLGEDLYLRDHALGRNVSVTDPTLSGLPVVPLTMSMEMLAEAAAPLMPGRQLLGMREIRAYRWMTLEEDAATVRLTARVIPGGDPSQVFVQMTEDAEAGPGDILVEGTMVFGDARPEPPAASALTLTGERPSRWTPESLYHEVMFHGPAFRGVLSIDRRGEEGAEASLAVLPDNALLASDAKPGFLTDPVLLDQPGQVVGFWTAESLETGSVVFPNYLKSLDLYGPNPPQGERLSCRARIRLVGEQEVASELEVARPDGRLHARFIDWKDRRFDLPRPFLRFLHEPREVVLSRPWALGEASSGSSTLTACRLSLTDFPPDFLVAHGAIWQRALACMVLGSRERVAWRALGLPEPRRLEWLLGRVAAKDALRTYLDAQHGLSLAPADIEILPDEDGKPEVHGAWVRELPLAPHLSLSHSDGTAVAVVVPGELASGVGVDLERVGLVAGGTPGLALLASEQSLLASLNEPDRESWSLRLWCAKEAAAKSVGRGMVGGPRMLLVEQLDPETGAVRLRLRGDLARSVASVGGGPLVAHTGRHDDLVVATCLLSPVVEGSRP